MNPFKVVVPARFGSQRLPGKAMLEIGGIPMVVHAWRAAKASGAEEVVVATDDQRIADVIEKAGGNVAMTDEAHRSGTERIGEVVVQRGWAADTIVVNLQGDEPFMPAQLLRQVAAALADNPGAGIATLYQPIESADDLFDPNVVKVMTDAAGMALYFSRAPVPWVRDSFPDVDSLPGEVPFRRHLGLYAYRAGTVVELVGHEPSALEVAESLEQLRALHHGIGIYVAEASSAPGAGIDTAADLDAVRRDYETRH